MSVEMLIEFGLVLLPAIVLVGGPLLFAAGIWFAWQWWRKAFKRKRKKLVKCACQWEAGDSPCPVHGEDDS